MLSTRSLYKYLYIKILNNIYIYSVNNFLMLYFFIKKNFVFIGFKIKRYSILQRLEEIPV